MNREGRVLRATKPQGAEVDANRGICTEVDDPVYDRVRRFVHRRVVRTAEAAVAAGAAMSARECVASAGAPNGGKARNLCRRCSSSSTARMIFFFKQKTAYEILA